jgi:taurine dioxygenase
MDLATPTRLQCRPLTPQIGAEIHGVDLSQALDDAVLDQVRQALWQHGVIFFRDQHLTPQQHIAVGRRFGDLHVHPLSYENDPEHPDLLRIHADENSKYVAGEEMHTDVTCEPSPPMASMLYLREVPPAGGDTLFASMTAAYDALSPTMQQFLEGLTAVHDGAKPWMGAMKIRPDKPFPRAEHPVVTVHPHTGRKILFVNRGFTTRIRQLMYEESAALLEFLYQHLAHPRFQCRFRWQPNSIAFWDNRCTQHQAIWDYYPARRSGHRVTLAGQPPEAADVARVAAAPRSYPKPR